MEQIFTSARGAANRRLPNWLLAGLFWAFTYSLFSYRAQLRFGEAFELFVPQRIVATLIGAALYWLVLSSLIRVGDKKPASPFAVIGTILPASIVVLASRLILDGFLAEPSGVEANVRFMMVWAGYFGLWISGSLALRMSSDDVAMTRGAPTAHAATENPPRAAAPRNQTIDQLAADIANLAPRDRAMLLRRVTSGDRYDLADPLEALVALSQDRSNRSA